MSEMKNNSDELSFEDYRQKINIQEALRYAGYVHNKRDGSKYPSFVRLDNNGQRISGDKFLITPDGQRCFKPPTLRSMTVTGLIYEHPEIFPESATINDKAKLVHAVCRNILNLPPQERSANVIQPRRDTPPFNINDYQTHQFRKYDFESQKKFYPYFKSRGINLTTQSDFRDHFMLASKPSRTQEGKTYTNLAFPMKLPNDSTTIVGLEERGKPRLDGSSGYKGMARGSNAGEGMWIASPNGTPLNEAKKIMVFESAYDAMAFYQMLTNKDSNLGKEEKEQLKSAVYVSTGGNPSYGQLDGLIRNAPKAIFHLGFDNDMAGRQFTENFQQIAKKMTSGVFDKVPEDMQSFVASFEGRVKNFSDMTKLDDHQVELLPKDLQFLYLNYRDAKEQLNHDSGYIFEVADQVHQQKKAFEKALSKALGISVDQKFEPIKIVRELPSEGFKDFNEELLSRLEEKNEASPSEEKKEAAGLDMDGNGTVELSESDEKKQSVTRHSR